jgi:hypothetical protein
MTMSGICISIKQRSVVFLPPGHCMMMAFCIQSVKSNSRSLVSSGYIGIDGQTRRMAMLTDIFLQFVVAIALEISKILSGLLKRYR